MTGNPVPVYCRDCIKVKECERIYAEIGFWPEQQDCFVPDCVKQYPINHQKTCSKIHNCIANRKCKCGGKCHG